LMTNRQLATQLRTFANEPGKDLVDAIVDRLLGLAQPRSTTAHDPIVQKPKYEDLR
jgi:hypothetical protein